MTESDPSQLITDIEELCYMYMKRYLSSGQQPALGDLQPHYRKFVNWMQKQVHKYECGDLLHGNERDWDKLAFNNDYFASLVARLESSAPEAQLAIALGEALPKILNDKVDPLRISFENKLSHNIYAHMTGIEILYANLCGYIDALAHKNPDLAILEVGAGTGGATVPIIDTLMHHGEHELGSGRFRKYDFTDLSPYFFDTARELFQTSLDYLNFRILDIELDPLPQGFEAHQYDVVIAANVLHATKHIDRTLQNLHKLLKPGGKLLLLEVTNFQVLRHSFVVGMLPGWWLSEDPDRQDTPLLSTGDWSTHLKKCGFSGVDISFDDYPDKANQAMSVIVSTAEVLSASYPMLPQTLIIADMASELPKGGGEYPLIYKGILFILIQLYYFRIIKKFII